MHFIVFDAAGPTRSLLYENTTLPVPVFAGPERLLSEATILDGPFEGERVRTELIGRFDLEALRGEIDQLRSRIDGVRHFQVEFDEPIRLQRFAQDLAAAAEGPFEFTGNRFGNRYPGGPAEDVVRGGDGADRLRGLGGDDVIDGGVGDDALAGGSGDDRLIGGAGADRLLGGVGRDEVEGGAGADVFAFRTIDEAGRGARRDVAQDLGGRDAVDLAEIDARTDRSGDQAFRFIADAAYSARAGELRYAKGIVGGDVDGDGRSDFHVEIATGAVLEAGDFLL